MATLVVIPTSADFAALDGEIAKQFNNKALKLPRGEWLVSYEGTSKQLCDALHISDGGIGVSAVVLNFDGYFGRSNKDIWEWLAVNATMPRP